MSASSDNTGNPLASFGLIADVQYADLENGSDFAKTRTRYYRNSLKILEEAVDWWKERNLSCVVQLGDVIDGKNSACNQSHTALDTVLSSFKRTGVPVFHMLGNHEFYNFSRDQLRSLLFKETGQEAFYSFPLCRGWRAVVLDPYDISVLGHPKGSTQWKIGAEILHRKNPETLKEGGKWLANVRGRDRRFLPYNGAIGAVQLQWLREELQTAEEVEERVVVFCHVPLLPMATKDVTVLWNYEEVLGVLGETGSAAAVFAGHDHDGGYFLDSNGIHHVTVASPLECEPETGEAAFGCVHLFRDGLEVEGRGKVTSVFLQAKRGKGAVGGGRGDTVEVKTVGAISASGASAEEVAHRL